MGNVLNKLSEVKFPKTKKNYSSKYTVSKNTKEEEVCLMCYGQNAETKKTRESMLNTSRETGRVTIWTETSN